ncbi:leucine-rich repeat [Treponema sp. R8-4-B8]
MKITIKGLCIAVFIAMFGFALTTCDEPVQETPKPKDSIVNIATIQGVTIPVTGATPVRTITENAQYSGVVTWNTPSAFAAETQYTATIMLTAKTGYTLQGVAANFFRVTGATSVSNAANSGVITAVFPATGGTASNPDVITIAAIDGVTIPVTGEVPVRTITENSQYSGAVTWNGSPSAFAANTQYTATITLTAKTGFTLQGVRANFFTVAGTTSISNNANSGVVTAAFPATGAQLVTALTGTVIITGYAEAGQILTANTDSLKGSGTISYQWKRGSTNIGTNSNSYEVQTADIGSTITVTVTRSGYSGSVTSPPTITVIAEVPPTPGLAFTLNDNSYSVSRGTATAANVVIPALHEGKPVTTIENNAFSSYTNMTSVRIPDRITSIGSYAFSNCTGLTSVTIPSSVTSIGTNAFTGCTSLTSISIPFFGSTLNGTYPLGYLFGTASASGQNSFIPASLKTVIITGGNSVPASAFSGCTNLTSVTIPSSVLSIGQSAFSGCTGLPSITIPSSVTSIGNSAFSGCTSLPSISIPDSVLSIGNSAFSGCTALTNVTIENGVTSIGQSAFSGCTSLPSVIIPDSVTSIGDSAFRNCTSLESITLPFIGKSINATTYETVFGYIFGYTSTSSPTGATYQYSASSNSHYYYYIPTSLKTVVITNITNNISARAFINCSGLTSVTIPNSVTSIGGAAFYGCTGLTGVTIPNNVTSIGDSAFYGCTGLTGVTIPNNVTSIGDYAFSGCTGLTSVTIGNGVTSIGREAFYNCSGLTGVTIPNNVTSIDGYAFSGCSGMTSVTIGNGVTSIGYNAFSECTGLTSINFNATVMADINNYIIFKNAGQNAGGITVNIGANVTRIPVYLFISSNTKITVINFVAGSVCQSIGDSAFSGCTALTSVTIPNSMMSIGNYAFYGCTGLTSTIIGNGVTSIGYYAFSGCTSMTSVTIGNGVTSIGDSAFSDCTGLTSVNFNAIVMDDLNQYSGVFGGAGQNAGGITVNIGANVTKIPAYLFYPYYDSSSPKITAVNFAAGSVCQSIGYYAFYNCTGLTSVTIPNSVTSIGNYAFSGCSGLTSVTIGNGVTSIGGSAFSGCTGLTGALTIPNGVTSIDGYAFYGCSGLTSVMIGNGVTSIGGSAFQGCSGLSGALTIPNGVTSIGGSAFQGCSGLSGALTIPNGVTSIGDSAFSGCSGLTGSLTIPNGVTSISDAAFRGCSGLTSVTIGNGVTRIGGSAFQGCSGLTSVTIPNGVTSIGGYAFYGCSGLTSVTFQGTIASSNFGDHVNWDFTGPFSGDLGDKYYATNTNGTPGTYTRASDSYTWTKI